MKKPLLLAFFACFLAASAFCQTSKAKKPKPKKPTFERFAVKLGASLMATPNGLFSIEKRVTENAGFEFSGGFFKYKKPDGLKIFNGIWVSEWSQTRVDSVKLGYNEPLNNPVWRPVGDVGPLPASPPRVANSAAHFRVGYRYFFSEKQRSKWRVALAPSLTVTRFDFFDSADYLERLDVRIFQDTKNGIRTTRTTEDLRQTRRIDQKAKWQPGIALEAAVTRRLRWPFFIEARATAGTNIDEPFLDKAAIAPVGQTWRTATVQFGMFLGDDPLAKKSKKKKAKRRH